MSRGLDKNRERRMAMRITVAQDKLQEALGTAVRATASRPTLPTLAGVFVEATADLVRLTATDLGISIQTTVPAKVDEPGAVVLPARRMLDLVRKLDGGEVRIEVGEEHRVSVRWERSRFTLFGMAPRLFPKVPGPGAEHRCTFDAPGLKGLLRRTTFAVARDETRPVLTGVCIEADGERVRAIATDGYRVAIYESAVVTGKLPPVIIPGRALAELARILPDDGPCHLSIHEGHAHFELGSVRLTTRVIEGQYPNILDVIPNDFPRIVLVERERFLQALERAALVSHSAMGGERNVVRLQVEAERVLVSAKDAQFGEGQEEIPASVEGPGLTIGFNARYLIEGLRVMDADEVELALIGPVQAARLRGVGEGLFSYVAMPVKIGGQVEEPEPEPEPEPNAEPEVEPEPEYGLDEPAPEPEEAPF